MLRTLVFNKSGQLVEHILDGVPQPLTFPKNEWPFWAKALKAVSTPDDKGIGDVISRVIGTENSAAFKSWHIATFGKSCGCDGRQARLNRQYPLP